MREQIIIWRNDFDNIPLPFEYDRHFESEACIARLSTGKCVAGNFSRLKGLPEVSFHAVGIAFYGTECIKEFAFLE